MRSGASSGGAGLGRPAVRCALLALAAILSSCRNVPGPDTLVIAIEAQPRGLDPRFSTSSSYSARIMQLLFDTLVIKDERLEIVPFLAESFTAEENSTVFTFRLRPGISFHDGKPLTSADVKYTFDSILAPETKSPLRGAMNRITSVEAPDPLTVILRAREPFYTFVGSLPAIGIIPEGAGAELISSPVGTGPYRFVSFSEGQPLRLEANPGYWRGAPATRFVEVQVIPDNSTRQAALMSGEVDMAYNAQFDPETIKALGGRSDLKVLIGPGPNIAHLGVNLTSPLLANGKVRQALACALDRDVIIERLLRNQARRAESVLPPEQWAYDQGLAGYDYEPERAKQLLDEAGYRDPDGDGPQERFEISLMTTTNQLSRNIGAIMQDQFRRVGIRLLLESFEMATLQDRISKAQFDLYYLISVGGNQSPDVFEYVYYSRYQDADFNDAIAKLRPLTDPAQMRPQFERLERVLRRREYCPNPEVDRLAEQAGALHPASQAAEKKALYLRISALLTDRGGANRSRYCNPQVDRWILEAERKEDRAAKKEMYARIQQTLSDELPQVYLWYPANILVTSTRVDGVEIEPTGSWFFITKLTLKR